MYKYFWYIFDIKYSKKKDEIYILLSLLKKKVKLFLFNL